ncbi:MAG: hypothetical protein AAB215_07705, partial [Planctomycetota bacterium]
THLVAATPLDPRAMEFLPRAGRADRVDYRIGDALDTFHHWTGSPDMVFVDLEKGHYPAAIRAGLERLPRGGLLAADNMLWFGRVIEDGADAETKSVLEATRLLFADVRYRTVLLPLRDGVSVSVRI